MGVLTIVHTRRGMLLTKQRYSSWRELQDVYDDYMASLGPYDIEELIDYLDAEYPSRKPFERAAIEELLLTQGLRCSGRTEFCLGGYRVLVGQF